MTVPWRSIVWQQFGATIDSLEDVVHICPDELWQTQLWTSDATRPEFRQVWYRVYHALFWLDLYLTGVEETFVPPEPFELIEMEHDQIPARSYTKAELLAYLADCRKRCQHTIEGLTDQDALRTCRFGWGEIRFLDLQLYNMRHAQEQAAQLSLFLGQNGVAVPDFVSTAR